MMVRTIHGKISKTIIRLELSSNWASSVDVNLEKFCCSLQYLYLYRKQTYSSLYQNCFSIKKFLEKERPIG